VNRRPQRETEGVKAVGSSDVLGSNITTDSMLPKINVINRAERRYRSEQAKHHVQATRHVGCFVNSNRTSGEQTENNETQHRLRAGIPLRFLAPIFCLCLCAHKMSDAQCCLTIIIQRPVRISQRLPEADSTFVSASLPTKILRIIRTAGSYIQNLKIPPLSP
jgi:hypothetical protein